MTKCEEEAKRIANEQGLSYIISDEPPGIGCPVISSLSGVNLAVIITEPTLSGMYDLDRIISVCHHFKVPVIVGINKYDPSEDNSATMTTRGKSLWRLKSR